MCNLFIVDPMVMVTSGFHYGFQLTRKKTFELSCLYLFKGLRINLLWGHYYCLLFIWLFSIYLSRSVFTVSLHMGGKMSF